MSEVVVTTIRLEEELRREMKTYAAQSGVSMSKLVSRAFRKLRDERCPDCATVRDELELEKRNSQALFNDLKACQATISILRDSIGGKSEGEGRV